MGLMQVISELEMDQEITISNFAATLNYIETERAQKIKNSLDYYGVRLTKTSELKYYTLSDEELNEVLKKLQYCKEKGFNIVDEKGSVYNYLFDLSSSSEFYRLYPDADLTTIVPDVLRAKRSINADIIEILESSANKGLTEENYDRYLSLEGKLTNVMQVLYGKESIDLESTNNLIKLVSSNKEFSESDILLAVLLYNKNCSAEETIRISQAINDVLASLNQGGAMSL